MKTAKLPPLVAALARVSNYASFLGFIPFYWCRRNNELVIRRTWTLVHAMRLTFPVSNVLYLLYQSQSFVRAGDIPFVKRVNIVYVTAGTITLLYNVSLINRDARAICGLVNAFVRTTHEHYGKLEPLSILSWRYEMNLKKCNFSGPQPHGSQPRGYKSTLKTVYLLVFMVTFISLTYSVRIIWQPQYERYLTSLLKDPSTATSHLRALIGLYHMYAIASRKYA